ncbi:hypothetical protein Q5H93_23700 [Hymenobacter sp. ASUV-10]|uniref:Uncharacterized protein n=1 Tax=Hymenobacter aranciens TaxID=3063996 RepID=A0ABT9BHL8_9BACT|nr:hypothetical protein [Hymenobacter sp. ASUV-10]MDO7877761.1 hypothetical protein [Hymenobacter sp. ASUV-10]
MKKIFSLLLMVFFLTAAAGLSEARDTKPGKASKASRKSFRHTSESSKGKNSKAQFRKENKGGGIVDLNPRSPEKFKTARANPGYKYLKPH